MNAHRLPWSSAERCGLAALVLALAASLVWLVHPWYDATNDGSMYIACARSIVAGEGYAYLGEPFRIRPPGLSLLIAPVIALRGTDFHALNLLVASFGAAGVVLLYLLQRERLGPALALLVAAATWSNPGYQRSCNQVMSEMPGIALLLLALLAERGAARKPSLAREVALGLCIAAAAYVRTVDVLLVPAILVARLLRAPRTAPSARASIARALPFAVVAVLALLPWSVRNARVATPPPADQTYLYSYSTGLWHEDAGDPESRTLSPGEVLARVPEQTGKIVEVLGSRMQAILPLRTRQLALGDEWSRERDRGPAAILTTVLLLAGSLYVLARRREPAEIFTWLALGVIAVYFGFDDRLLMPVWVLAFPAAAEALRDALRARFGTGPAAIATAAVVALVAALDFHPRADWERIRRQHEAFASIAAAVEPELRPGDRVAAPVAWHYAVYLDRPVHSFDWAAIRARRGGRPDVEGVEEILAKYDLDTVVLSPLVPVDRAYLPYVRARSASIVELGPAFVARVR